MPILCKIRHDTLLRNVERRFGARTAVIGQGASLHVVLRLHDPNHGEAEIIRRAAQNGIGLFPFSTTRVNF